MALLRGNTEEIILQAGQKLNLRDRNLSSQDVGTLARVISSSTTLEVLNLYNVRLSPDDAAFLSRALEFNKTLATLNFTHNPIGEVGTAALAEVIKFNNTIQDVSLANIVLHPKGCALLADALIMNRTLASLNLEKNRIGSAGAEFLSVALSANETLRSLSLDGNDIGDGGAIAISTALSSEGGSRLRSLSLSNSGIGERGAAALGEALKGNLWLQRLVMAKQEIFPQALQGREGRAPNDSGGASTSKGLQTIDCSGQGLSATLDYPIICRLAAHNPRLARLRLSRAGLCGVTSAGRGRRSLAGPRSLAMTLAAAPPRFAVLDVSRSFVDDSALDVIARGLENNRVLTNLILHGNDIGAQGAKVLSSLLPPSLVELDISDNPRLGERGAAAIARFLLDHVRSSNLRRLDISSCGLRNGGLESLAEGLAGASMLEWLGIAGNLRSGGIDAEGGAGGAGKAALGRALLSRHDSRLQGLSWDKWSITKGQKELKLTRPRGSAMCPVPTAADAFLLAGVIFSNVWVRSIVLDGNPLDEEGLGHLCIALLRNRCIETVSLRRCGLSDSGGLLLLRLHEEKPGLEVDCAEGNHFGEYMQQKLSAALERARSLTSVRMEKNRTLVHFLGDAGAGKTTLKESLELSRSYFSSWFNSSRENAEDTDVEDSSQRTLGLVCSEMPLGSGSSSVVVQECGGMSSFRGLGLLSGSLRCPTSVYVLVVSLATRKLEQKRQIKYWLRFVQAVGPSPDSILLLAGSRAETLGSVGQSYLQKLWEQAREDCTRELLRAGMDATLPTFAGCFAMDCRKSGHPNVARLRDAIAHADLLFEQGARGWQVSPLSLETSRRMDRWVRGGARLVKWTEFVSGIRQLCPRASEATCADIARSLSLEAKVLVTGLKGDRERDRGKAWVALVPQFVLHNVVGGLFRMARAAQVQGREDGVISAANACRAVLGGLGLVDPEELVQMLLNADFCAEVFSQATQPEEDESTLRDGDATRSPPPPPPPPPPPILADQSTSGSLGSFEGTSLVSVSTEGGVAHERFSSKSGTIEPSLSLEPRPAESLEKKPLSGTRASWTRLERRMLVFPTMLPPSGSSRIDGPERGGHASVASGIERRAYIAGRRIKCQSPLLPPGLFHVIQARLGNRYPGKVRLQHARVSISLDWLDAKDRSGSDTSVGSDAATSVTEGEDQRRTLQGDAIEATVELLEKDEPGGDFVDVVVTTDKRRDCFLMLLSLRLVIDDILRQVPALNVEDMVISGTSLHRNLHASQRSTSSLLEVQNSLAQGDTEYSFDDDCPPQPLRDLVWEGREELPVDENGRIITVRGGSSSPHVRTLEEAAANPFAPAFASSEHTKDKTTPTGDGEASPVPKVSFNPFSAPPDEAVGVSPSSRPDLNPFSPISGAAAAVAVAPAPVLSAENLERVSVGDQSLMATTVRQSPRMDPETEEHSIHQGDSDARNGSGSHDVDPGGVDGTRDMADMLDPLSTVNPRSGLTRAATTQAADAAGGTYSEAPGGGEDGVVGGFATAAGAATSTASAATGPGGEAAASRPSFTFDEAVFRDARRLFRAHLRDNVYTFRKQRVEVAIRRPGSLLLGIWRAPVDEREERDREKERERPKVASVKPGDVSPVDASSSNPDSLGDDVLEGPPSQSSPPLHGNDNTLYVSGSESSPSPRRLSQKRPAVVEEVKDERVISDFNFLGSDDMFPLVGLVVAGVSHEPFESTEAWPKLPTYEEVTAMLASREYPLFVQFCRPPLLFTHEPEYPPVKLLCSVVCTNRNVEKVNGEFRYGDFLTEEQSTRWAVATTAVPVSIPDLGKGMVVNLEDHHLIGMYTLTQEEAMSLLASHPSDDLFVYVHGFNTPFGYGVRSIAVKARAFKKSLGVCLAWPSNPPGEGVGWLIKQVMSSYERRYTYCEHNMHATIFRFLQATLDMKAAADRSGKGMCWKGHSMGCYLLLNLVDRLRWKGEDMRTVFSRMILDAPDVPTWFFQSMVKVLADNGVEVCHYFNPGDNAIQASCTRKALERPVPGNDPILSNQNVQAILCDKVRSSNGLNHDYGRTDGRCLLDQRDFLAGEPPEQRVLEEIMSSSGKMPCWHLNTYE